MEQIFSGNSRRFENNNDFEYNLETLSCTRGVGFAYATKQLLAQLNGKKYLIPQLNVSSRGIITMRVSKLGPAWYSARAC